MPIDFVDILKIAGFSSVPTVIFTWLLNHVLVQRATLKRDKRYLAQRLAIILERFSVDCANVINDNDTFDSSGGAAGRRHAQMPVLGAFPSDSDWKAIDADFMDRVLSMPNEIELANQAISFWCEVEGDEDCMRTETNNRARQRGLKAWLLACELRRRCGIPTSTLREESWDFVGVLEAKNKEIEDATPKVKRKREIGT